RSEHDHDGRSVEEQDNVKGSLLELYRDLAKARAADPALRRGQYTPQPCPNKAVWRFLKSKDDRRIEVAINRPDPPATLADTAGIAYTLNGYGWAVRPVVR